MIKTIFSSVLMVLLALSSGAVKAITIEGSIKNSSVKNYKLTINKITKDFNQAAFALDVPEQDFYQLKIEAEGYYPLLQTFSHYELTQLTQDKTASVPTLEMVKRKAGRVMLAFGGDVMMGRRYSDPSFNEAILIRDGHEAEDTKKIVAHMKPYMELADYAAVNLETQISETEPKQRAPKGITFYSPPETLGALKWAGIDYVTLGNNHIYDYLDEGLLSTLKYLKEYNMDYSGAGFNQREALEPYRTELNGQAYSMLGFVGWEGGGNPNQVAEEAKGGSAFGSKENIIITVSKEAAKNRTTIVQYHGSLEYKNEPTGMTESRLKTAVDKGADLVVAHHPHVTQGFELYQGKLIAYSLGNFIFDQYFHSTPHSFVLYVWMDGEEFHRAEIVPVYIKGYVPVPATGLPRNTISKRVTYLSGLRGLNSELSGGHIILTPSEITEEKSMSINFKTNQQQLPLYSFPVNGAIEKVTANEELAVKNRYRLGKNLLNGGDFETFNAFTSDERSWELINANITEQQAYQGRHSVTMQFDDKNSSRVGMKTFRRVFKAGNPMSFEAKLKTNENLKVKLFFQRRKTRDKLSQGLANEPVLLGETSISSAEGWQTLNFEFNTPRVGYRSYRVWLEVEPKSKATNASKVFVDEISLIEWQAHYNEFGELPRNTEILGLSTHIGLEKPASKNSQVTIEYR